MTVASRADIGTEIVSSDRLMQVAGLLLCTVAALLPLYYSPLWSGAREEAPASLAIGSAQSTTAVEPPSFDIVFGANRHAMMRYRGYLYLLKTGDELPDGRHVREFVQQGDGWRVAGD